MTEVGAGTGSNRSGRTAGPERRLVAILAADVAGYSRLMAANEAATLATLKAHREVIDRSIAHHHGRIVGTAGDSVLAEFRSPVEAVECAVSIQRDLGARNAALAERQRMEFRIGINLGDVLVDGEQIYGDGVNIAARLEGLADAGAICVSGAVVEQLGRKLPYWYDDQGRHRVKNIPEPVHIFTVDYAEGSRDRAVARLRRRRLLAAVAPIVLVAGIGSVAWFLIGDTGPPTLPGPSADLEIIRDCDNCPELVVVPAGSFMMGSSADNLAHQPSEGPQRRVAIAKPFAMGRSEVTFAQWDHCMQAGKCEHEPNDRDWGRGNRPVIYVSWEDTQTYVSWLSEQTGHTYRLPSEAEWEYAARAGSTTDYWWGSDLIEGVAVCADCGENGDVTAPVGSFPPNPFGIYDVHGNVWEWTQDCWNGTYAGAPSDGSAWTAGECDRRVVRGGSWGRPSSEMRLSAREGDDRQLRSGKRGFRVVRELN